MRAADPVFHVAVSEPRQPRGPERLRPAAERPSAARPHRRRNEAAAPSSHPHGGHASGERPPFVGVCFQPSQPTSVFFRAIHPVPKRIPSRLSGKPAPGAPGSTFSVSYPTRLSKSRSSFSWGRSLHCCSCVHGFHNHLHVSRQVRNGTKAMPPSVRCLDWSPAGCAPDGGCVIAVCSSDYRVRHPSHTCRVLCSDSLVHLMSQNERPLFPRHSLRTRTSTLPPFFSTQEGRGYLHGGG